MTLSCPLCGECPDVARTLVVCPRCGLSASESGDVSAMEAWVRLVCRTIGLPEPLARTLDLLDSVADALGDMEPLRDVPGAMTIWRRVASDVDALRSLVGGMRDVGKARRNPVRT